MGVTNRLVFDPTDANTIAGSSSVGAYVRAGSDGDLIASQTIAAEEWLNVASALHAGDGTAITETAGALDVNIASGAITVTESDNYAEDSAHTTADTGGFVLSVRVDDLDAVPAGVLAGTEGDYQAFITGPNGELFVGGDVGLTDGTNTLSINADGSINTSVAECTELKNTATAVSLVAVDAVGTALADRKEIRLANEGNISVYFGQTGVTAVNGFPLHPGMQACVCAGDTMDVQLIGGTGASSEDVRVLEIK